MDSESEHPRWVQWFRYARQVVLFVMGVVVMLVGLFTANDTIGLLVIGMILAGVLPLDNLTGLFGRPARPAPDREP